MVKTNTNGKNINDEVTELELDDNKFTLQSDTDNTRKLQFSADELPSSTTYIPIIEYNATQNIIPVGTRFITQGPVNWTTTPVSGAQLNGDIRKIGEVVFLQLDEFLGTYTTATNQFTVNGAISFPPTGTSPNMPIYIVNNGTTEMGLAFITSAGNITISRLSGNFTGGTCGYRKTTLVYTTQGI